MRLCHTSLRQPGDNVRGVVTLVAQRHLKLRRGRQITIQTRAEADEPVTLALRDALARLHITEYTPCNQTGNLNHHHILARVRAYPQGIALVVPRSLVQGGVKELSPVIPAFHDLAFDRTLVRMDIENVHKNADALGRALEIRIFHLVQDDHPAIRRGEDRRWRSRYCPRRVTKELEGKKAYHPQGTGP